MTGAFDRLGHFFLELPAVAREAAGKDFSLLIHELHEEIGVLVIDVLDAVLLEPAVLWFRFSPFDGLVH